MTMQHMDTPHARPGSWTGIGSDNAWPGDWMSMLTHDRRHVEGMVHMDAHGVMHVNGTPVSQAIAKYAWRRRF